MWLELVLNGVGGRTIAEAKQNLSYKEATLWFAYMRRYGSLNTARRLEQELAEIKLFLAKDLGYGVQDVWDFLPHEDAPEINFNEAMQQYEDE